MILPTATSLKLIDLVTIPNKKDSKRIKTILMNITGKRYVLFTNKGRDAIYHALKDMRLNKDDEVILPGYTCSIVREAVKSVCTPKFVDINENTLNMDQNKIEKAITKKTKAILLVHAYGHPNNIDFYLKLAKKHNLKIIEDCAQALKARFKGKYVGSFGDYTVFSFGYSKDLSVFKTGALASKHKIDINLINESSIKAFIQNSAVFCGMHLIESMPLFIRNLLTKIVVRPYVKGNEEIFKPSNLKPSKYTFSLLYKQFKRLDGIIDQRISNARFYNGKFKCSTLSLQKIDKNSKSTYFRYNILSKKREDINQLFLKKGIFLGTLFNFFIAPKGLCPISERVSEQIINLPVHHRLTKRQLEKIAVLVQRIIK